MSFIFQIAGNIGMNSSDDELPDIPGTRFPWMNLEDNSRRDEDPRIVETSQQRYTQYFSVLYS